MSESEIWSVKLRMTDLKVSVEERRDGSDVVNGEVAGDQGVHFGLRGGQSEVCAGRVLRLAALHLKHATHPWG